MAVPTNISVRMVFQDNRGYKANTRVNLFEPDISTDGGLQSSYYATAAAIAAAVAAMSNAKLVEFGYGFDTNYAQEPASETGQYQLVLQKARIDYGDGAGGFSHISVPAPKDTIFLAAASDNLVTVDPADSLVVALAAAVNAAATNGWTSPRLTPAFSEMFGGQLVQGKPRVRRVLQGP